MKTTMIIPTLGLVLAIDVIAMALSSGGIGVECELWLGDSLTGDNKALFGNRNRTTDFDGETDSHQPLGFRCAYDLIPAEQVLPSPSPTP